MMRRSVRLALSALAAIGLLAGCGASPTVHPSGESAETVPVSDQPASRRPVLVYDTTGGCLVLGPNCPRYVVYDDGTVELFRSGEPGPPVEQASIPATSVTAWLDQVSQIDVDALIARLPPGSCQSCVDGIDVILQVQRASGPVTFDSTVVAFDPAEPFFADLEALMAQVRAAAELQMVGR